MAPLGLRDRDAGTVTLSTSLGLWKKLERIRREPRRRRRLPRPRARAHGPARLRPRPGPGVASRRARPRRLESITPEWERFLGPRRRARRPHAQRYYWQRVPITIEVERIVAYRTTRPAASPRSSAPRCGAAAAAERAQGRDRARESTPAKAAAGSKRLPHTLLGWCGATACRRWFRSSVVEASSETASAAASRPASVPASGRRAGSTCARFGPRMVGQEQRVHTGWRLERRRRHGRYAPHTRGRLPAAASTAAFTSAPRRWRSG